MKVTISVEDAPEQSIEIVREQAFVSSSSARGVLAGLLDRAVGDVRRAAGLDETTGQPQ